MGFNQSLDTNGRAIQAIGYDPTTHQPIMQLGGPGVTDASSGIIYGPSADAPVDGFKASYSAAVNGYASYASAQDILAITGSATMKAVRITHVEVSGIAATILDTTVRALIRLTANTLGTPTTVAGIAHDQNNPAATALVQTYAAAPTVNDGTTRIIRAEKVLFNLAAPTAGSESGRLFLDFGTRPAQAVVLRGVAQQLTINLNGVTIAGPSIDISIEWTEDNYS